MNRSRYQWVHLQRKGLPWELQEGLVGMYPPVAARRVEGTWYLPQYPRSTSF
jgi:hypothetical protein